MYLLGYVVRLNVSGEQDDDPGDEEWERSEVAQHFAAHEGGQC